MFGQFYAYVGAGRSGRGEDGRGGGRGEEGGGSRVVVVEAFTNDRALK